MMAAARMEYDWNFVSHILADIRNFAAGILGGLGHSVAAVSPDEINPMKVDRAAPGESKDKIQVSPAVGLKAAFRAFGGKIPEGKDGG